MKVEVSQRAREDIIDILEWTIWNFGPQQAELYRDGIFNCFDLLEDNPRMGQVVQRGDDMREIRRVIYRMHYVFYEVSDAKLKISTIRHTRQKLPDDLIV